MFKSYFTSWQRHRLGDITAQLHWFDAVALTAGIATAWLLVRPAVWNNEAWRATITPLASIIGSGFLVVAPILAVTVGSWSIFAMIAISFVAFLIGSAIRYNILRDEQDLIAQSISGISTLDRFSDIALALAYVISVAFYLRLLASFVVKGAGIQWEHAPNFLATAILVFIGVYGYRFGLRGLEQLEKYSVTIKLSIIVALLLWLFDLDIINGYSLAELHSRPSSVWEQFRVLAGMLLVVQGFETSRYMASEYSKKIRVRTMITAQLIASGIYILFIFLVMPFMDNLEGAIDETTLIDVAHIVTPLLPPLLVVAAIMSQFSAAVADTVGAGGMIEQESKGKLSAERVYPIIMCLAIGLIWMTNIFELVTIASRAFAFYYMLQTLLATKLALTLESGIRRIFLGTGFAGLSVVLLGVVLFAKAVEL